MKFLEYIDCHGILIFVLPSHSTHRLQPLNIGLFTPLAKSYTNELNTLMYRSLGMVSMSKRMFWPMFRTAWFASFTEKNIASAFTAPGIFPYDPATVLLIIQPRPSTPIQVSSTVLKTPMTSRAVRRAQRSYKAYPTGEKLDLIFRAKEQLAAQHSIDEHVKKDFLKLFRQIKNVVRRVNN